MKILHCFLAGLFVIAATLPAAEDDPDNFQPLLDEWHKPVAEHRAGLRDQLIEAAIRAERPDVIEEVSAGGNVAGMEIKLSKSTCRIAAKMVFNLGKMPGVPSGTSGMDYVIRRMTNTRFELWTPRRGWLFDSKGRLLNKARPPRRDGIGREWYGAFLPDGRWVTTDLWDLDRTLTFFSRHGKWVKEITSAELAPYRTGDDKGDDLIGWARCDRNGTGWVVSVGSEGGRAVIFVKPHGKAVVFPGVISDENEETGGRSFCYEPWKLCYPRDLEPKGYFCELYCPSDDCKSLIALGEPGHGMGVGFPGYTWNGMKEAKTIPRGDHDFGFLPGSHDVFLGASDGDSLKTWFFSSNGKCRGWIKASYMADSADGKGTCYYDREGCIVTLGSGLQPQSRTQFTIAGKKAVPVTLFTDLKLGFFDIGGQVALARW